MQHKHLQSILFSRNQSVELPAHRCGCLDTRKYSFTAHIVNIWNSLPNFVVDIDIVSLFKAHLDKFWMHQDVLYDFTGLPENRKTPQTVAKCRQTPHTR